jgi:hypothetical protein
LRSLLRLDGISRRGLVRVHAGWHYAGGH